MKKNGCQKKCLPYEYNLETLAKGIIHEIRNPLNSVYAHVQLLEEEIGEERKDLCDGLMQIKVGISQIDGILREFGRFVRQTKPMLRKENLNSLLNDVLKFVDAECHISKIKIVKQFQSDLPEILVDANQIKQVVLNLILNANQAMLNGGALTVTTFFIPDAEGKAKGKKKDGVCVEIQDTGMGISKEQMTRIFDLFYSTKSAGTGLGLPIVQKTIHDHDGKIEIDSQLGKGTRVRVVLPV
ncbi:MAG: ATP-binding protein [bacterium]|nr:ATP-binding protein [bacterium]